MSVVGPAPPQSRRELLEAVLRKQRAAHHQMRPEPLALRKDRIQRAMKLLTDHADDLCKDGSGNRGITVTSY